MYVDEETIVLLSLRRLANALIVHMFIFLNALD